MLLDGLLVGVAVGGVITLYRIALAAAERSLRVCLSVARATLSGMILWTIAVFLLLVVVSSFVRLIPSIAASGIPQVEAELEGHYDAPWLPTLVGKSIVGPLCTLAGLSLGREGPSIQLGGMAAKGISRILKKPLDEERILITCGAAAGMSAAFHAPLTGVMFAIEEIHKTFSAPLVISVMAASIGADFVTSQVLGLSPVLRFTISSEVPRLHYPLVVLLGALLGLLGAAHNRGMFAASDLLSRVKARDPLARYAIAFAASVVVAFVAPELLCGGDAILEPLEGREIVGWSVVGLMLAKYAFTALCFGSGAPGGTLFPLVVLGGLAGSAFGMAACRATGLASDLVVNFAMLGVCGLFASVVRSPVTAVILVFELTGSFDALLSLSVVSITSYLFANFTLVEPFYEHLLARLTKPWERAVGEGEPSGRQHVHGHVVEVGSRIVGRAIREVDWPNGLLVVSVVRDGQQLTPTGETVIQAFDTLSVVMDAALDDEDERWLFDMCRGNTGYIEA